MAHAYPVNDTRWVGVICRVLSVITLGPRHRRCTLHSCESHGEQKATFLTKLATNVSVCSMSIPMSSATASGSTCISRRDSPINVSSSMHIAVANIWCMRGRGHGEEVGEGVDTCQARVQQGVCGPTWLGPSWMLCCMHAALRHARRVVAGIPSKLHLMINAHVHGHVTALHAGADSMSQLYNLFHDSGLQRPACTQSWCISQCVVHLAKRGAAHMRDARTRT